jgi:hypothetical protein
MESKEWALGKKPARGKAAPPPSLTPRPAWQLLMRDFDLESSDAMQALRCCAQTLLVRGQDGGSHNVLRCVLFVVQPPDGRAASASLLQTQMQADKDEEASSISTSPNKSALAPASFNVLLIFDGDGRRKQSVKRTVEDLLAPPESSRGRAQPARAAPLAQASLSLEPCSFPQVLQLITAPHVRVHAEWNPAHPTVDVTLYIARRVKEGAHFDPESTAVMAGVGLDLLGPRRKHSLPPQPQPPKRLKGPEPTNTPPDDAPPTEASGPSADAPPTEAAGPSSSSVEGGGAAIISDLQQLLHFDGTLTEAVAADRATALLSAMHAQSEELFRTKLQLNYYEERDRLEATVRPCFKNCSCCETHRAVCV